MPTFKELPSSGKDRKQTEGLISVIQYGEARRRHQSQENGGCMLPGGTDAHDKSYRCLRNHPSIERREKAGVKEHRREKLSVVESGQGRVVSSRPLSCHLGVNVLWSSLPKKLQAGGILTHPPDGFVPVLLSNHMVWPPFLEHVPRSPFLAGCLILWPVFYCFSSGYEVISSWKS